MKIAKASVIVPYYKKKKYIKRSIESVLSQTYKNFEIIIIYDDKDKSDLKYIKNLKKLDKRIRIIVNSKNLGAGESRNIGIRNSQGKYICFLDADDSWNKKKLFFQINYMIKNNYNITHTTYEIRNTKEKYLGIRRARSFKNYKELLPSCDIGLSTVVAKKKIFTKGVKFSKIKTKEDFVLWLKILKKKICIRGINKNLAIWRATDNSLSSSFVQKIKDAFFVYSEFMNFNLIKSLYYVFVLSLNFMKKKITEK